MVGQTISHYKIVERLGGGGMGVVYKAQDLRLDRFVALKFLPATLDSGEEWQKRFTQEAKAASSLDHPNICTIHHIGMTDDGQMYIVMGYYPGETLTAKIQRGPLPVREAVGYAIQVAAGLAKAHHSGIVHRDIKPANIIVTTDGLVKVLDFGLALLSEDTRITLPGSRLGTPAYMSPEQAQGTEIDHRTDIWSLGVVLYEMISGKIPFKGSYDVAIIYSVINEDPEPIVESAADAPAEIHRIISRALAKDPAERYQQAKDFLTDLEAIAAQLDSGAPTVEIPPPPPKPSLSKPMVTGIAAVVAVAAGIGIYFAFGDHGPQPAVQHNSTVTTPAAPEIAQPAAESGESESAPAETAESQPAETQTVPPVTPETFLKAAVPKAQPRRQPVIAANRTAAAPPVPVETKPGPTSPVEPAPASQQPTAATTPPGVAPSALAPVRTSPPETRAREAAPAPAPEPAPKRQESSELADWARVRESTDVNALAAFLNKYPNGTLRQEAMGRMEELKWAQAGSAGTAAALRDFLREFPNGRHASEAGALAAKLEAASSESSAVIAAVQRLAAAYQQRDADAIKTIWPSLSAAQMVSIGKSLHDARSVKYELRPLGEPRITGGAAQVACRRSLQFEFAQGAQQPVEDHVAITLRKQGGNWLIENVQTQ